MKYGQTESFVTELNADFNNGIDRKVIANCATVSDAKMICDILNRHFESVSIATDAHNAFVDATDIGEPIDQNKKAFDEATKRPLEDIKNLFDKIIDGLGKKEQKNTFQELVDAARKANDNSEFVQNAFQSIMATDIFDGNNKDDESVKFGDIVMQNLLHFRQPISSITVESSGNTHITRVEFDTTQKPA